MLSDFDKLVKQREQLKNWWKLGSTIASYDNQYHKLTVHLPKPSMIAFCGQAYAGAKNYHDAPDFFAESVRAQIQKQIERIIRDAYESEITRLDSAIESHRQAVLNELSVHA